MLIESCQLITGSIVSVQSSDASDGSRNDQPVTGGMWRVRWQGGGHTTQLQVRFNSYFDEYYSNKAHKGMAHWHTATFFGYIGQIEDGNCGLLSAFVLNSQVLF